MTYPAPLPARAFNARVDFHLADRSADLPIAPVEHGPRPAGVQRVCDERGERVCAMR
jgi:hypothetical protein